MSNKTAPQTLAAGAALTPETWADFVARLKHDCQGEGVRYHYTAAALFTVQRKVYVYGIDEEYSNDRLAIIKDESAWRSIDDFLASLDEEERADLDKAAEKAELPGFEGASTWEQADLLRGMGYTVTGWDERWEFVGAHFTKAGAEAFIKRKGHDYRDGLRVYVEAQPYAWEFEAIKEAIMGGRLVLVEPEQKAAA